MWYFLFYQNLVFDVLLTIIETVYFIKHECDIDDNKVKTILLTIIALILKTAVCSLNNLEISGLHTYKRLGPHVLPFLCTFLS